MARAETCPSTSHPRSERNVRAACSSRPVKIAAPSRAVALAVVDPGRTVHAAYGVLDAFRETPKHALVAAAGESVKGLAVHVQLGDREEGLVAIGPAHLASAVL